MNKSFSISNISNIHQIKERKKLVELIDNKLIDKQNKKNNEAFPMVWKQNKAKILRNIVNILNNLILSSFMFFENK